MGFKQLVLAILPLMIVLIQANFTDLQTEVTGKSLSEALLFAEHGENMLCTKIVLNVRNKFSPDLSLEISCVELVIQ